MGQTITRRKVLAYGAMTSFVAILPRDVSAIEPMTALQAVGAVAGVLGSINQAQTNSELTRQMRSINAKLDIVILNQQYILQEIESLRLFIDEVVWRSFRTNAEFDLGSLKDRYSFLMAGGLTSSSRGKYDALATSIQDITNKLGRYDFGAFVTFASGVGLALMLRRLLVTPPLQMADLRARFKEKLDEWLNPNNARGVAMALTQQAASISGKRAQIEAYPREITLRQWSENQGDESAGTTCKFQEVLTINGDLTNGFSGVSRVDKWDCRPYHSHCKMCAAAPANAAAIKSLLATAPDYSGVPAPGALNSPFAGVNEINALRNEWIALSRHERDLQFVKAQIEAASASLKA